MFHIFGKITEKERNLQISQSKKLFLLQLHCKEA